MKPIGPLMREHRLIERMVALLAAELERMKTGTEVDLVLVDAGVDFFRSYADRTHHGKEEDILFRDLAGKNMTPELVAMMEELLNDHVYGRAKVGQLVDARNRFVGGDVAALTEMVAALGDLVDFYPAHIFKEDKRFFFPCQEYFSSEEQDAMLREFEEFDRMLIHEKYTRMVERFEG
jgi:hemerythrin-like domain-containing protein